MKTYGYLRISTKHQSLDRQEHNIRSAYPDAVIIGETFTGGGEMEARPAWTRLAKTVKAGDRIVFDSVSRMSRNASEGIQTYMDLYQRGVDLVFIREPHLNTEVFKRASAQVVPMTGTKVDCILSAVNDFLFQLAKEQIEIGFSQAEKELEDIRTRTREGIKAKKRSNDKLRILYPETYEEHPDYVHFREPAGQKLTTKKSVAAKEIIRKHNKSFGGTLTDKETASLAGISINSLYKYKAEMRKDGNS